MKKYSYTCCLFLIFSLAIFNIACRKEIENQPPHADAGPDITTTLSNNSQLLDGGNSYDPDDSIVLYEWQKVSGPGSLLLTPTLKKHQIVVSNLSLGVYEFELKVTDSRGLSATDVMKITVQVQPPPPPQPPCDNSTRPQVTAQLIPVGTLSQARSGMAVATAGTKIVFAGGGGTYYADGPSSRVDIYDTVTHTWSSAELTTVRSGIGTVAVGNKIFFAGGMGNGIFASCYSTVDVYDVSTNSWSVMSLSEPRSHVAAATVGNKIFFAGGYTTFSASTKVDIYDLSTNSWSTAQLTDAKGSVTAVTLNNKIYFAGGNNGNTYSSIVDIYDNATNTWATSGLTGVLGFLAGVAVNDNIYWAGDCKMEIRNINSGNSTLKFLSSQGSWTVDLGQNAVVKDNKIILLRHYTYDASRFDVYDLSTNNWSVGVLPVQIGAMSIIAVNNNIYLAGGWLDNDYHLLSNRVWRLEF